MLGERGAEGGHLGGDRDQSQFILLPRQGPACVGVRQHSIQDLGHDVAREQR
jgi:hypothetical protein